ncbi:MAG: bifunctional helix-turn-helix transcriptional regulator/GNAT family N-acetyltransferase [Chloroflexi bacterium]|nr:bifunctional helix-turn-helix transcriptional regulator/GNAT family N-acetyltransferase [Chloroflexota bacterium]
MTEAIEEQRILAVRHFNRFYTQLIGVLNDQYLQSPFSLTEVRVLYELAHREQATASELKRELGLDAGYLSRLLRGFVRRGYVDRLPSTTDGRQTLLRLSDQGRTVFAPLHARSSEQISVLLGRLLPDEQERLLAAMATIGRLLGDAPLSQAPYLLRPPRAGELGWVVQRHGAVYAAEYGYDEEFEGLVAGIVAHFAENYNPKRERCWIAEREGEPVGSVFLVSLSATVAKLRLFLVEPRARGLGIGKRLVEECISFARSAGYDTIRLWTQSELLAARHIYDRAGFRLIEEEPHHSFGKDLVAETWELAL